MYRMKSIIVHDTDVDIPKCMYAVKKQTVFLQEEDINLNISNQGSTNMTELEQRQDELLQKLDILYDRIKNISSQCNIQKMKVLDNQLKSSLPEPKEIVIVVSPDSLPWYLYSILKQPSLGVNISWHVHSSVPNEDVPKITKFVKMLPALKKDSKINIRLIFKCVSADTELKLSTLAMPIVGHVNILRYLSYVYPNIIPYDPNNHQVDYLLDLCHMLERTTEKNKEALATKLCSQQGDWLYAKQFSIVDLAAYNIFKQWKKIPQYVPKPWFAKCEKQFV